MDTMTPEKTNAAGDPLGGEFRSLREALVMIVDDEPLTIEVTQAYLEQAGFARFVSTTDPTEAIELMLSERPQLVLLDLLMPGLSGFDIMGRMRADPALRHTPVIVLTSSNDPATKLKSDRKSTRLNSSHANISYAVFCLKKQKRYHAGR